MARITTEQAIEMGKSVGGDFKFLTLGDREVKKVRFLCSSPADIDILTVHQVQDVTGKQKNIDCLRAPNEPVQKCPLCEAGNKARTRVYLFLISENNDDRGTIYLWERSSQFIDTLEGYYKRYGELNRHIFEVERRGAKGDKNTTYNLYYLKEEPLKELPQKPEILGRLVLEKSEQDCADFLRTGAFKEATTPNTNNQTYTGRDNGSYERRPVEEHRAEQPPAPQWDRSYIANNERKGWN